MHEVIEGCKVCGKRMLTDGNPLVMRTCDACKAEKRHEQSRRLAAKRKADRHEFKKEMGPPRCEQCGEVIEDAARLTTPHHRYYRWEKASRVKPQWTRKFCDNACRQAAFRARARVTE